MTRRVVSRPLSAAHSPQPRAWGYVATLIATAALVAATAWWLIESERRSALTYWEARESGAADVMASRVSAWLDERRADAEILAATPSVYAALSGTLSEPTAFRAWLRQQFTAYLTLAAATRHYQGIYVLAPGGEVVAHSAHAPPLEAAATAVARAGNFRLDLYGEIPERSLASFTAPVALSPDGPTAGSVMIMTSLADSLFPLLTSESAGAESGETLLVRRDGADIAFINPLRHRPASSPQLRVPFETTTLPSRWGLMGRSEAGEFADYRGVAVIAATRPIPQTGWGLVSKIDRDEALADARVRARLEAGIAGLLIVAVAALLRSEWQRQRARLRAAQAASAEALRAASLYTRSLIEASLDPLVTISADGKITDVNTATEQATGVARGQLIGTDFCDYFTEPERARDGYRTVFAQGMVQDYPLTVRHVSGRTMEVLYNASVYRDEAGAVQGVFAAARDVTERNRQQQELGHTLFELARSNDALQQFAYVASHDLQEPLRMVASYVDLLARRYRGQLDADADEFIGYAVDGALRMQRLINDLLSYSRIGTRGREFAPADCERVFAEVLANLQEAIAANGAVVTHDPLPSVLADDVQLAQVLQNLIDNAIKFHGDAPPRVHVSAERQNGAWRFTVRDNGIGINPEYVDQLFVIFHRLHSRQSYSGTGIGLATCKRIVERHGGRIWAESQRGRGSTFFFTLPDASAAGAQRVADDGRPGMHAGDEVRQ
jgi:PAS domain S-box-containing protein